MTCLLVFVAIVGTAIGYLILMDRLWLQKARPAQLPAAGVGDDDATTQFLAALHMDTPEPGSDSWWAEYLKESRRLLDGTVVACAARIYAAVGPEVAAVMVDHEERVKRRWASERHSREEGWHATPEFWRLMQVLIVTGEWPVYARAAGGADAFEAAVLG